MGSRSSSIETTQRVVDKKQYTLGKYFRKETTIEELWHVFESGPEGSEEVKSQVWIEDVIFESLNYFCKYKCYLPEKIDREEAKPYVDDIVKDVQAKVDSNIKETITRDEFMKLGTYLTNEFQKMKDIIAEERIEEERERMEFQETDSDFFLSKDQLIQVEQTPPEVERITPEGPTEMARPTEYKTPEGPEVVEAPGEPGEAKTAGGPEEEEVTTVVMGEAGEAPHDLQGETVLTGEPTTEPEEGVFI